MAYEFDVADAVDIIYLNWSHWAGQVGCKKFVIGISGGKDSTVVAALAVKFFGKENVVGVMLPNGEQKDIEDSIAVCKFLDIPNVTVNIGRSYEEMLDAVAYDALKPLGFDKANEVTTTNMPARLRMTALYAIAQSIGGMVINTSNLSEDTVGYATLFGDNTGSYAPLQGLTVTEVKAIGDYLGLPKELVHKIPVDGLQNKTDEEKLGFSYADLDAYIRENKGGEEFKANIDTIYRQNRFKTDMVNLEGPDFSFLPNYVAEVFYD